MNEISITIENEEIQLKYTFLFTGLHICRVGVRHRAHFRYVGHSEDHGFLEALAKVVKYSSSKSINSTKLSSRPFCPIIHMDYCTTREVKVAVYWPNFYLFFYQSRVEVHNLAKKRMRPMFRHLYRTNLINKGFIKWLSGIFCGMKRVVPSVGFGSFARSRC